MLAVPQRQDHLAPRPHHVLGGAVAIVHVAHADRTLAVEQHRGGARIGAYLQPAGRLRRMQEHTRRRMPPAAMDRALEIADALLPVAAVVVGAARDPHADGAGDERLADRMDPVDVGDRQVALAAMDAVIGDADPPLGALVVGQHVDIAPAAIAALRPTVEVGALAAVVDHAVDRAGPAERAALRGGDCPTAAALGRLGLELPGEVRVEQHLDEAGRHVDVGMPIRRAGFQHADRRARLLGQPVRQHRAGGAAADDDVVERTRPQPR